MLEGKTILITGSSRGIGAETARRAKSYGARVILHGRQESEGLKLLARELDSEHIACDVTEGKEVTQAVGELLNRIDKVDSLVNCAGVVNPKPFADITEEDWMLAFRTNVLGTFFFCQALVPHMKTRGSGCIVNVASIRGYPSGVRSGNIPYSATKAAVINMTAGLAKELAPDIRINSVSPGATNVGKDWDIDFIKRNSDVLLKRIAEPKEIAETILFLASDKSSFVTGQDFVVDGGYIIGK